MKILLALRPLNLLMVAVVQYCLYQKYFVSLALEFSLPLTLIQPLLSLFILDTIVICAAGYFINDFIDFETDRHNDKLKIRSKSLLLVLYVFSIVLSFTLSLYIANCISNYSLLVFWLIPSILLFIYSRYLKSTILLGNLFVASFIAASFLIYFIAEKSFLIELSMLESLSYFNLIWTNLFIGGFAFIINLIREIVKDFEDKEGDLKASIKTFANQYTLGAVKWLISMLYVLLLPAILLFLSHQSSLHIIALLILILPIFVSLLLLVKMKTNEDAKSLSTFTKFYMVMSLAYLLV